MITEKEFQALRQKVGEAKSEADRAQGALDQLMSQLEAEFACTSVKEAVRLLAKLDRKKEDAQAALEKGVKDYERKWKR